MKTKLVTLEGLFILMIVRISRKHFAVTVQNLKYNYYSYLVVRSYSKVQKLIENLEAHFINAGGVEYLNKTKELDSLRFILDNSKDSKEWSSAYDKYTTLSNDILEFGWNPYDSIR